MIFELMRSSDWNKNSGQSAQSGKISTRISPFIFEQLLKFRLKYYCLCLIIRDGKH